MMLALVRDGIVVELIEETIELDGQPVHVSERFAPDFVAQLLPAAGGVEVGWRYDGTSFNPPAGAAVDLVAYARDARWRAEMGGMVWNSVPIATDDSSKLKITGARIAAEANPAYETTWWGADGEGVVVDATLIIQLSDAVLAHVDATFTTFGLVKAGIETGTITSREEIDAAFA